MRTSSANRFFLFNVDNVDHRHGVEVDALTLHHPRIYSQLARHFMAKSKHKWKPTSIFSLTQVLELNFVSLWVDGTDGNSHL
ncbi:uncharacterized protein ARMOST_05029 [Armillaria ostoyae]|uniref:Uncharacterized protein n=1 Tax=Armillaria ostoyae TaxID=47428 RepID=A0A284QZ09_ARMOS|nr:uncharacterized protein ARMOST_05029 [Armillaria ostoyae]